MRTVKCLRYRGAKRRVLRVLNNHCRPRERLKRDPMQTNCAAKRENRHKAASSAKHFHEASERRYECQCGSAVRTLLRLRSGRAPRGVATFSEQKRRYLRRDKSSTQRARPAAFAPIFRKKIRVPILLSRCWSQVLARPCAWLPPRHAHPIFLLS